MKTLVLLSGGLDSAVVLAMYLRAGDKCTVIGFDYGQKHRIELQFAGRLARHYDVPFEIVCLPNLLLVDDVVFAGRNLLFAAVAVAFAQARGFDRIAVGCNETDYQRFPDCRPIFWNALATCADAYGIEVATPLLQTNKRGIVEHARRLEVPIEMTWSCYSPQGGNPCMTCLACKVRQEALELAGVT